MRKLLIFTLFAFFAKNLTAGTCNVISANLHLTTDQTSSFYINGTFIGGEAANGWANVYDYNFPADYPVSIFDPSGDNVLAFWIFDRGGGNSGGTYVLTLNTSCGTQYIHSDGTCTYSTLAGYCNYPDSGGTANHACLTSDVYVPSNWETLGFDDSGWNAAWSAVDVAGNNGGCTCWPNFSSPSYPEVPTVWGRNTFDAVPNEGYFFRQYFTTSGAPSSRCFTAPTPTPGVPLTPGPTRTPYPCLPIAMNGDMEATPELYTTDAIAYGNWYARDTGNCTETHVTSQSNSPTHSLELDVNDNSGAGSCAGGISWVQNLGCPNLSCPYTICAWVKSSTSAATGIFIAVEQYNAAGTLLTPAPSVVRGDMVTGINNTAWTQYCITVGNASAPYAGTTQHLRIVLGNSTQLSTAWFDDVTVSQSCGGSPTYTPTRTPTRTATRTASASATLTPSFSPSATRTATPTPSPSPTHSPTRTPSATPTATPSATPSPSPSPTRSASASMTASPTHTPTATPSLTSTHSASPTPTFTVTSTRSSTPTPSASPTQSPTRTWTLTATESTTVTFTPTWTPTPSVTATRSSTATPSASPTQSPTRTSTLTATESTTVTYTPTWTPTSSVTATRSSTASPSDTRTVTPSFTISPIASDTVSPTVSPTDTASPTVTATRSGTQTPTFSPTVTPTATPSATPSDSPTLTATPSSTPSGTPTPTETPSSTASPVASGTASPSVTPTSTASPSVTLTATPTHSPSASPSWTATPSATPSATASPTPTASVTPTLSSSPTPSFSDTPTASPSSSSTPVLPPTVTSTFTASPVPMPLHFKVTVYNSAGEAVLQLFEGDSQSLPIDIQYSATSFVAGSGSVAIDYGTLLSTGGTILAWNGGNQSGQPVESGVYTIKTEMIDSFGKVSEYAQSVQVLSPPPMAEINIYNSAGELVYHEELKAPGGSVTGLDLNNQVLVLDGTNSVGLKLSGTLHSNAGPSPWSWDGKNLQGMQVSPGVYEVHLNSGQGGGVVVSKSVQVLALQADEIGALKPFVAPNPVTDSWLKAGKPLALHFIPSGGALSGRLYNLAGELISTATAPGSSGQMRIYPGPLSSGVYILALDYVSSFGATSRKNLKLVILR